MFSFCIATRTSTQATQVLWRHSNDFLLCFHDSYHCLPFSFSWDRRKQETQVRGKKDGGSLQLRGLLSFCLSLSIPWFLNPLCLPSLIPPFLLAGQALYYGDKSMHVWVRERVCVSENVRWLTMSVTCVQEGSHLPKLALIAPFIQKAIRDSVASLCLSIIPPITDVICH